MDIISESLHVHEDGLSSWERNDVLEFLSSIALLQMLFYCHLSFGHPKGMSNARLCSLCGLSLLNKNFVFIFEVQDFYQDCWE